MLNHQNIKIKIRKREIEIIIVLNSNLKNKLNNLKNLYLRIILKFIYFFHKIIQEVIFVITF
jgi:hypothetical protein